MARDLKLELVLKAIDKATKPIKRIMQSSAALGNQMKETRDLAKQLNRNLDDVSAYKKLTAANKQTSAKLAASKQQLIRLQQASGTSRKELDKARNAVKRLGEQYGVQQRELSALSTRLAESGIRTNRLGVEELNLRRRIERTNNSLEQQRNRLAAVTRQQERLSRARSQYQRTQGLAGSMASNGAGGLATGSALLYGGARMLAPGLEFDASMSKVQALTRLDKQSPELKALREQARQLGSSTQFTAVEAANAQGFLGMAGFKPQAIQDAMPGMLDLAKAGDTDLAQTADIASNILTGFNLQAKETGRLGDVLVGTFTRSNTNLQMLGETMKYVAPVAAGVGQNIETVAAMAGKLGDAGIQGSMGGTALRAIMSRLAEPPKMAAKALKKLGINAKDAQGNLRDMPTVLTELYERTKALGNADRAGYFKAIAGAEAFSGLQVLVDQAGTGKLQEFIATLRETQGEAQQTAKVMSDNLKGDITALGSAWSDLGIEIQEQQDGPFRELAKTVTGIITSVKNWVAENPKLAAQITKTAAGIGVLMAGMGGLTLAMASMLGPFAMVRYGLMLFGIRSGGLLTPLIALGRTALPLVAKGIMLIGRALLLNPIGLAISVIAGAAYIIYRNWEPIKTFFSSLWTDIKAAFELGIFGIMKLLANWSPLGLIWRAITKGLEKLGVDVPDKFRSLGSALVDGLLSGIFAKLGNLKTAIVGIAESARDWFAKKLGIHSPSRVFAELGGFTMAGLSQGIERGQSDPLASISSLGKQLAQAGALTLGMGAGSAVALDQRPPLAAGNNKPAITVAGDTIQITIEATPGTDTAALEHLINKLLNERERNKAARLRSALFDIE